MRLLVTIFLFISLTSRSANYYFSSNGNDAGSGTQSAPWKTITKFNSFAFVAGDIISFNKGDTFFGQLIPQSGIIITSYGSGADPIISGGTVVTNWVSIGNGIYEAALASEPKLVTISNVQYAPGRFPNTGWLKIDATNGQIITSTGLSGQPSLTGASVVIRMERYVMEKCVITSQSGNTISFNTTYGAHQGWGFFITNKLSTLDQFGEWYYSGGMLKVFSGTSPPQNVIASTVNDLVVLNNKNQISFSNIDFRYANTRLVQMEDANSITFDNCKFTFSGTWGLRAGGNNNKFLSVINCTMTRINSDGIKIYGDNNDGLVIRNNTFISIGTIPGEGGTNEYRAIALENYACINSEISFNRIDSTGYNAVSGSAPGSVIKNNFITNFCLFLDDGSGIYVQSTTGTGKRITGNILIGGESKAAEGTPWPTGTQIKGIYSDAWNINTEIDNNSVTGCDDGIYVSSSVNINVHHNTLFANRFRELSIDQHAYAILSGLTVTNNIGVSNTIDNLVLSAQNQCNCFTPVQNFGVINNNVWGRPLNDTKTIISWTGVGPSTTYTLAEWRALYGYDMNSNKSPVSVSDPLKIRFEYNATNDFKTIQLGAVYTNMYGATMSTVILAPFSSIILLQTGVATPPLPPPTCTFILPYLNRFTASNFRWTIYSNGWLKEKRLSNGSYQLVSKSTCN